MNNIPVAKFTALISGHFRLCVIRPDGSIRRELEFDNVITDIGMDRIGLTSSSSSGNNILAGCIVGTGNTPESVTDTQIESFVAGVNVSQSATTSAGSAPDYASSWNKTFTFGAGAAAGNLTEIGIHFGTGANSTAPLFSRTLIKDSSGNPITLTILSDEVLAAYYTVKIYPPLIDGTGTFNITIDGVDTEFSYTVRPQRVNQVGSFGWASNGFGPDMTPSGLATPAGGGPTGTKETDVLAGITGTPGGVVLNFTSKVDGTYVPGSYTTTFTVYAGLTDSNFATGIGCIIWGFTSGVFQMSFSPKIPKNSTNVFNFGVSISWARS